MYNQKGN